MTLNEVRKKYLDYFASKNHVVLPSASLLPENDPSTLFTGSGMQPMVPYLLGESHPEGVRLADSQKCFRSQDIEEVGDNRHTTFFEMLGNWSLGDYFKKEQISWMFSFLVDELGLDPKNLYVTVYGGNDAIGVPRDEESVSIWKEMFASKGIDALDVDESWEKGMQEGRIFYYDDSKNWWSRVGVPDNMPVGEPGGPDTEMFWDFGSVELDIHERSEFKNDVCHVNCDCGRFLEIGNNVFMEYQRTKAGFEKLSQHNVDFGGGLERIAAAILGNPDVFTVDVFNGPRGVIERLSGKQYADEQKAFRVILDHMRAATFLIADGAFPSNKDQGYFTRRLIRRSVRFAHGLGIEERIASEIVASFIDSYAEAYPQLETQRELILSEVSQEEEKFLKSLQRGLRQFEKLESVTGKDAFDLFATYGFPLELTQELAEEKGFDVDVDQFKKEFAQHQELSRQGGAKRFKGGLADHSEMSTKYHTATHLLHQALRDVLGDHVQQKGSNITADRLRFDFTHGQKMTPEEKAEVEKIVNEKIAEGLEISFSEMSVEEAKNAGAIGLFEDKYGDVVKVYTMGEYSTEICGGPHVENTNTLGTFKIKKEESSSSGVRRIKAILK